MKRISKDTRVYSMSKDNESVITVSPGESLIVETHDCFTGSLCSEEVPISEVPWEAINPATGPIYIEGAEPGDILVVSIERIEIGDHAVMATGPRLGVLGHKLTQEVTSILPIEGDEVVFNDRIRIPIRPMIGVIGTAPEGEAILCGTPGDHGGNMDCKEITAGTKLMLPVFHSGALLALGDVHAAMADGEVSVSGAEIGAEVEIRLDLIKGGMSDYPYPILESEDAIMVIDSKETLEEAIRSGVEKTVDLLVKDHEFHQEEALRFLSLAGDVRICQVVDPLMTIRIEIKKELLFKA